MCERGPELVNLPRGSQVIPNHELGGTVLNVTFQTDARGADPSVVARLEANQRQMANNFRGMVQEAIRDQRFRGPL